MSTSNFFSKQSEQSKVKARIVSKYFDAWASIIAKSRNVERVCYLDLFSGQGVYTDGAISTPIMVLETTTSKPILQEKVELAFNDENAEYVHSLQAKAATIPGYGDLRIAPSFTTSTVGEEITRELEQRASTPTLMFVDPWGYKALSLDLIDSVLRHDKSEVIFYFNYRRINAAITNATFERNVNKLFGCREAATLRGLIENSDFSPHQREEEVINTVVAALRSRRHAYVRPFRFYNNAGTRILHHVIHATKHPLGLKVMKTIMAGESTDCIHGVPTFEFNPYRIRNPSIPFGDPIGSLADELLHRFRGRNLTVDRLIHEHHVDADFIDPNYKEALRRLDDAGKISTNRADSSRKRGQMSAKVWVTFPA